MGGNGSRPPLKFISLKTIKSKTLISETYIQSNTNVNMQEVANAVGGLSSQVSDLRGIVDDMRNIQAEGLLDQKEICSGVEKMAKVNPSIASSLNDIKGYTSRL